MNLTFFGSSLVSSYWNGAATYYRGLLKALAARGHRITFCEPDAYGRQQKRDLPEDPEYARVVVYRDTGTRDSLVESALGESDWVIKCSGVGIWDRELEEMVAWGDGPAARAFLDVDAPATLGRLEADSGDPFRAWIEHFDHIFTYGGGPPVVSAYEALGARACTPIYNALDPAEHYPYSGTPERAFDLLFMGNRLPDREARMDEFFFEAARLAPEARFALGGEGWGDKPMPANVTCFGHVPTSEHNRLNASARLILNVHRESMVRNGWSPATRMFEAAGAGGCQITDSWAGIGEFFEPGSEILVARNGSDVVRLVREIGDEAARSIGRAALDRARRDHTYEQRAELLDAILLQPVASP